VENGPNIFQMLLVKLVDRPQLQESDAATHSGVSCCFVAQHNVVIISCCA